MLRNLCWKYCAITDIRELQPPQYPCSRGHQQPVQESQQICGSRGRYSPPLASAERQLGVSPHPTNYKGEKISFFGSEQLPTWRIFYIPNNYPLREGWF